jgi:hypothetical protein
MFLFERQGQLWARKVRGCVVLHVLKKRFFVCAAGAKKCSWVSLLSEK